jgi:hypothetical protein
VINKLEVGLLARVLLNQALLILKDKEIAKLQKQVGLAQAATDRMESCYIQMKKEVEQLQSELKCCRQENHTLISRLNQSQLQDPELEQKLREEGQFHSVCNLGPHTRLLFKRSQ